MEIQLLLLIFATTKNSDLEAKGIPTRLHTKLYTNVSLLKITLVPRDAAIQIHQSNRTVVIPMKLKD